MKRNRVKAAGLGLALWAGYLHGADPQAPAMLPAAVRGEPIHPALPEAPPAAAPMPAPVLPADTVWLPAKGHTAPPSNVIPAGVPHVVVPELAKPLPAPTPLLPEVKPAAPKLPEIPLPVAPMALPTMPKVELPVTLPEIQKPPAALPDLPKRPDPLLKSDTPVPPKPRPVPPAIPRSKDGPDALPNPTPIPVKPVEKEKELPTAPPELMVPSGVPVPGKHGTFGSPGVRISKDFPALHDLIDHDLGLFGGVRDDDANLAADRLEFRAEYLLWWANNQRIPVLATTSVNGGFGFLDDPGTRTLLEPGSFGDSPRGGFRARAGYWFDDCGRFGIDGSFFFLANQATSAGFDSNDIPTITRPIYAPNFPGEFGEIVAFPGISSGVLTIESTSKLWGFDLNLRRALCKTCDFHSEVFAGYRGLALNESLTINEFLTALPGNPNDPAGTTITVSDSFQTRNRFNGGQVGYAAERQWNRWTLEGRGSIALGNTSQTVEITGFQSRLRPGMATPDTFSGGLLAAGPNLGKFERDRFSVVPEFTLNLGYWITPVLKAYVGYNFLHWSNVVRAGDQIDRVVDVTFVPNPPPGVPFSGQFRPQPTFTQTNLSVNGIQFGIMGRW